MLENIEDIVSKYDSEVLAKLNKENMAKIIIFLQKENCDFIEDLLNDYIDLFIIEYDDFIRRYIILNEKDCNSEICRSYRKKGCKCTEGSGRYH